MMLEDHTTQILDQGTWTWGTSATGWICPKCGRVWANWVEGCKACNALVDTSNTSPGDTSAMAYTP